MGVETTNVSLVNREDFMKRLATLAAVLTLFGAGSAQALTRGGTFTYSPEADCIFLDPAFTQQNPDIWVALNIYDTLLHPSADGKTVVPGLASSYEVSPDALTITLKLRPGIKFSDGSAIEPSDVKFTLDRAHVSGEFAFLLESIDKVETQGTDTVVLHLKHPDPAILWALATFNTGVVPEKLLQAAPGNTPQEKAKAFAEKPVGSGPFLLTSWKHGSEMVLGRNPYYWEKGEDGKPLPYVDQVKLVIIPDDATRILKLKAGEIDGAEFVPLARVAELKADPKLNMVLFPAAQTIYLAMNNRPTLKDGAPNPLSDQRVRQALNYAVDKKAIIQVLSYGIGTPQLTFMPSSTPFAYTEKGEPYPYNPAKAKELLKQAGFANGFEVGIYAIAGKADDQTELAAIQQMWGEVGVKLKIQSLDSTTRIAKFKAGDYQMRTALWTNDINDPSEITSYYAYYPTVQSNFSGFRNLDIEADFVKSQAEMDNEKRGALYKHLQQLYIDAAPMVFLLELPYPVALGKKVQGFVQIPLGNYIFAGVHLEQ
jgi:peptide/nickel transport system substrate-binding protein